MRASRIIIAAVGIGLLACTGAAHAQGFYFTSTFTPSTIVDSHGGVSGGGSQLDITGQSTAAAGTAPTDIVVANIAASSANTGTTPDSLSSPYTLTVSLTERTGSTAGSETISNSFTGTLSGTLSQNSADIANTFDNPISQLYSFSDGEAFLVTLGPYTAPGPPGSTGSVGSISAHVALVTPEPGSVALLLGLGVSGSWITYRRRRRKV